MEDALVAFLVTGNAAAAMLRGSWKILLLRLFPDFWLRLIARSRFLIVRYTGHRLRSLVWFVN